MSYLSPGGGGEVFLSNGDKLTVSRIYRKLFANELSRYLGEIFK